MKLRHVSARKLFHSINSKSAFIGVELISILSINKKNYIPKTSSMESFDLIQTSSEDSSLLPTMINELNASSVPTSDEKINHTTPEEGNKKVETELDRKGTYVHMYYAYAMCGYSSSNASAVLSHS